MKKGSLNPYLESSEIIDWKNPRVLKLARQLGQRKHTPIEVAKSFFEWGAR